MDMELKYGKMEINMKVSGKMIKKMDKVYYGGLMETNMKESLKIIKYTE